MMVTWQFSPMDSVFFRGSQPMNAGESAWIESQFPPTGRTLQGAVRTAILDYLGCGYEALKDDPELQQAIGDATQLGQLQLSGPWCKQGNTLYFPAPLDLVKHKQSKHYTLLKPSREVIHCDLGAVQLPSTDDSGYANLSNRFISTAGMATLLQGATALDQNLEQTLLTGVADGSDSHQPALADREPKIGLGRDNRTRQHRDGMLFAIAPVRLRDDVSLCLQIAGLKPEHNPENAFLQRVGGEGKLALIESIKQLDLPPAAIAESDGEIRFKLVLTTHALMPTEGWLPENFQQTAPQNNQPQVWRGPLNGVEIDIISACIGKPFKQGGWDHANFQARPLQAYVPAGSVYFCKARPEMREEIEQLHGAHIGADGAYGFGHVLVGQW